MGGGEVGFCCNIDILSNNNIVMVFITMDGSSAFFFLFLFLILRGIVAGGICPSVCHSICLFFCAD